MQLRGALPLDLAAVLPFKLGDWGTIFLDVYISKRWFLDWRKTFLGHKAGKMSI